MRLRPDGFSRYRDKSSNLSATLNKYLLENGLRPTKNHTVYSLRHSFMMVQCNPARSFSHGTRRRRAPRPRNIAGRQLEAWKAALAEQPALFDLKTDC